MKKRLNNEIIFETNALKPDTEIFILINKDYHNRVRERRADEKEKKSEKNFFLPLFLQHSEFLKLRKFACYNSSCGGKQS